MAMNCVCSPAVKEGFAYNTFVARYFSDCVWLPHEVVSFAVGTSSIGFWLCCQAPQFIKNCRSGSAEALSIFFLSQWLLGDGLNLIGAVMTHQLTTEIMTASLFIGMDVCIMAQWIYLHYRNRRRRRESGYQPIVGHDPDDGMGDHSDGLPPPPAAPAAAGLAGQHEGLGATPDQGQGLAAASGGDSHRRKQGKILSAFFAVAFIVYGTSSLVLAAPPLGSPERAASSAPSASGGLVLFPRRRLLRSREDAAPSPGDHKKLCNAKPVEDPWIKELGVVLGWISAGVYLTSRLPQIWKNCQRRSVEGLSMIMFSCAVLGNLTYALGIFLRSTAPEALREAAPWLLGSVGTLAMDFTILMQFFFFKSVGKPRRPLHLTDAATASRVPRGVHNAVDPFLSPFFPTKVKVKPPSSLNANPGGRQVATRSFDEGSYTTSDGRDGSPSSLSRSAPTRSARAFG